MKRYFYVVYLFRGGYGSCTIVTNNHYLNKQKFIDDKYKEEELIGATIQNIIELSEEDYEVFIQKEY